MRRDDRCCARIIAIAIGYRTIGIFTISISIQLSGIRIGTDNATRDSSSRCNFLSPFKPWPMVGISLPLETTIIIVPASPVASLHHRPQGSPTQSSSYDQFRRFIDRWKALNEGCAARASTTSNSLSINHNDQIVDQVLYSSTGHFGNATTILIGSTRRAKQRQSKLTRTGTIRTQTHTHTSATSTRQFQMEEV